MLKSEQTLINSIKVEFSLNEEIVSDDFIGDHPDILWLENEVDFLIYMPSYMIWCIKSQDNQGSLVFDYTINALAEFGRCKNPQNKHLNFKHLCNDKQKAVVLEFLLWCCANVPHHEEQLNRAIKSWENS